MTSMGRLIQRSRWWVRHAASSCLSKADDAFAILGNLALEDDKTRLIVLDDFFPCLKTGFRVAEFNAILEHFPNTIIYSSRASRTDFRRYAITYPKQATRVRRYSARRRLNGCFAYVVFLNNIAAFIGKIEEARLPFAFELYPGGGLHLDLPNTDARLSRIFGSAMFRKVIVTQNVTRDYLLRKGFCEPSQIEFLFGVVAPSDVLGEGPTTRLRFGLNKQTLDICFIANKYMPGGLDKGYDRFILTARILAGLSSDVRFHVVGEFTREDGDVSDLEGKITFYGPQPTAFFPKFHAGMDLILSPNLPFVAMPGGFDGFPTGCCIEAALCGTAMFVTDELGMNEGRLKDGEEIVVVSRDPAQIAETIWKYVIDPARLSSLAQNGQKAVRVLFSLEAQMRPRLRLLSQLQSEAISGL
jgi:glycosyltransferase involved in cell wall biosynthesis